LIAGVLLVASWFAWRYREQLAAAWRQLVDEWRAFWANLLGRRVNAAGVDDEESVKTPPAPPPPAFAEFQDPFQTTMHQSATPAQLVEYSFRALEAWARERGIARDAQQTPLEFAQAVGTADANVATEVRGVADYYCQLAYAGGNLPATCVPLVRRLWERLRA